MLVDVPDARGLRQNILHLGCDQLGSLQRGGVGKLDVQVKITLVLVGNEAGRQFVADEIARHTASRPGSSAPPRSFG